MPTARYVEVQRILQTETVRRQLRIVRDRKARQVAAYAAGEGVKVPIEVSEGTRPKGRPYARVSIPASHEFGDSKTKRLRLLGRVING